ncbi:hypothetical protein PPK13_gp37 [Bacillus phage Ray17]|uniref:Uncharacterized protein n=1 Tax=Bacillus phage Ray17 TaxID=2315627 RepID=A0A386K716_9CAUD|nr:hypothetical protein PPK13_gp37 [Bacillus phage Ray17]AYD80939.1 hypothetical protein Ray17_38 [Bacillus phage Ray17]
MQGAKAHFESLNRWLTFPGGWVDVHNPDKTSTDTLKYSHLYLSFIGLK